MNTKNLRRLISVLLVVILATVFARTTDHFLSARNILQLLRESSFVGLVALGVSFVIIGGGIDLSTGGIAALCGLVCARLSFIPGIPGIAVLLGGVLTGVACGAVNAFLITKVRLTEFVATLASGFVYSGLALLIAFRRNGIIESRTILNKSFTVLGTNVEGLYFITIVWVVMSVLLMLAQTKTNFGLHTYAQGSNPKSAQMSGVNNNRIKTAGFLICGFCVGLGASMVVAYQSAAPVTLGSTVAFQAIAACVVGGIVLGGGRGDAIGALLGSLFLTLILNGLMKYGLPIAWQSILQGGIIVLATAFDAQFSKLSFKKRIKARPAAGVTQEGGASNGR